MREPLRWLLRPGRRVDPEIMREQLCHAARGPADDTWEPPAWLYPHQRDAARRLAGSLAAFGGAICADTVGLGKTWIALALATRYRRVSVVVPAVLAGQWLDLAASLGLSVSLVTHERLSRGLAPSTAGLTIVDEAHRFRNPDTRRYRVLAGAVRGGHLLLVTATPIVNRADDLVALLRLFLPDNGLAFMGLSSLQEALGTGAVDRIGRAAACLTVARSPRIIGNTAGPLPATEHAAVITPSPVPQPALARIVTALAGLKFPACAEPNAAALLGLHLRYRFASSLAAGRQTLRRHGAWLDRAIAAAERGERIARSAVASLIREDWDGQLELAFETAGRPIDAVALREERDRIRALLADTESMDEGGDKAGHLARILQARSGKTLVFTVAVATARALARSLGWKRLAVVSGNGAWIASGRVSPDEALSLFAPMARRAAAGPAATIVDTLIATDLASEGLNLQDANAVVHYDLPWTPLRLSQRLGRVARLGSRHRRVQVFWFAPPPELDGNLSLPIRIARKGVIQLRLGMPLTSGVGQTVTGSPMEWREHLAAAAQREPVGHAAWAHVQGPSAIAVVITWVRGRITVPEIVVLEGSPPAMVDDPRRAGQIVFRLLAARASPGEPPEEMLSALAGLVRNRLAAAGGPPSDARTRDLARAVVARALRSAARRDETAVDLEDQVLGRVHAGLTAGGAVQLASALAGGTSAPLRTWLGRASPAPPIPWTVTMRAMLAGDGTAPVS